MIGASLDDGNIVLWLDAKQGERHSDVIVEVAFGKENLLAFGKDGADEFLRSRLAVRARNLEDSTAPNLTMMGGQILQGLQHIGNEDKSVVLLRDIGIIHNGEGTTLLEGLKGIVVSVERLALQGKENAPFRALAAIRRNNRMLFVNGI
jgi:hypothetical protein